MNAKADQEQGTTSPPSLTQREREISHQGARQEDLERARKRGERERETSSLTNARSCILHQEWDERRQSDEGREKEDDDDVSEFMCVTFRC